MEIDLIKFDKKGLYLSWLPLDILKIIDGMVNYFTDNSRQFMLDIINSRYPDYLENLDVRCNMEQYIHNVEMKMPIIMKDCGLNTFLDFVANYEDTLPFIYTII